MRCPVHLEQSRGPQPSFQIVGFVRWYIFCCNDVRSHSGRMTKKSRAFPQSFFDRSNNRQRAEVVAKLAKGCPIPGCTPFAVRLSAVQNASLGRAPLTRRTFTRDRVESMDAENRAASTWRKCIGIQDFLPRAYPLRRRLQKKYVSIISTADTMFEVPWSSSWEINATTTWRFTISKGKPCTTLHPVIHDPNVRNPQPGLALRLHATRLESWLCMITFSVNGYILPGLRLFSVDRLNARYEKFSNRHWNDPRRDLQLRVNLPRTLIEQRAFFCLRGGRFSTRRRVSSRLGGFSAELSATSFAHCALPIRMGGSPFQSLNKLRGLLACLLPIPNLLFWYKRFFCPKETRAIKIDHTDPRYFSLPRSNFTKRMTNCGKGRK
jgi:hypothetical protein